MSKNINNVKSSLFKDSIYNGGRIKKGSHAEVRWRFKDGVTPDQVEKIEKGCHCTAKLSKSSQGVVGVYNDGTTKGDIGDKEYITVTKNAIVYHNDGEPMKIKNNRGVKVPNPEKSYEVIFFIFEVEL